MLGTADTSDLIIFWAVVVARLLIPISIARFPLPGILISLLLDAVDQTLFQQLTALPLEGYQGYDKALDIYYLSVAYVSTLRNWSNHAAFRVSRFLFYWRLVGVALFELTGLRPLLLVFPNTFEYFFIFYEAYRLRWDPGRISMRFAIGAAAFIWIVIKLPQEFWIHIAKIDTTDWIKSLFGLSPETAWGEILAAYPLVCLVSVVLMVTVLGAAVWYVGRRLPPADRPLALAADAHQPAFTAEEVRAAVADEAGQIVDVALGEKLALLALLCISFAQVLPNVRATTTQLILGVAIIVIINTALSHWQARRGFGWPFRRRQFIVLALVNAGLILSYGTLRAMVDAPVVVGNALFFALLLALVVTLYDHYRQVYLMRFADVG